ncbi:hypothetical protein FGG08_005839 [Glutinoglossum americanum]|uniref:Cytochrome P450 alkane hydroxylase n=1 Tax=Glutinoglossum americanum TaxID=1670608 RepID=A0A9P8I2I3_9PEZI|nr:hypothetical protein FGG08_005839 [Glutinoglossum americanum]
MGSLLALLSYAKAASRTCQHVKGAYGDVITVSSLSQVPDALLGEMEIPLLSRTVAALLALLFIRRLLRRYLEYRSNKAFGDRHGCLPTSMLKNEMPLGLDRLKQIFDADADSRLMELFLMHFRMWGNTLEQVFLAAQAFGTIDPINLEAMLSTKLKDFGMGPRRQTTFPFFGDGIFTQDGPDWKHSRELLRPQFSHKQYQDLEIFREHVDNLIDNIPTNGGIVDLQPLFFRLTLDTTTAFLFGKSVCSLVGAGTSAGKTDFAEAFDTAQSYVAKRLRLLDLYWLIGGKEFRDSCAIVYKFMDEIIDRGLDLGETDDGQERHSRYVFLDVVAKDSRNRTALRQQMIDILVAGRDTTALRHPRVLTKLREEISSVVGGTSEMKRADLHKMAYLNNVLKESKSNGKIPNWERRTHLLIKGIALRLYPSVPVNVRTAQRTTFLPTGGGADGLSPVLIPSGANVAYSVYSMHRRPDFYGEDAEDFRPERWEEDLGLFRDETTSKWGYLPFNGGPRICLGMDFALTEAAYAVVRILQRFPIVKMPPDEVRVKTGKERQTMTLVLSATDGCKVQFG